MQISFDKTTEYILSVFEVAGFSAFVVGGSLRNFLLGLEVHDTDIATNARPDEVKRLFSGYNVIETGIKHGTVTLVVDHIPYEITTFRKEGKYSDNRRPDTVFFTDSLEEDLKRRDFTINSLAYSPKRGLVDLFGGLDDIERKTIRAVGNPKKRFGEDALRIMRGLRFSAILGFEIESETKAAVFEYYPLLKKIASERIYSELIQMLEGDWFDKVVREYFDIFRFIMPEAVLPQNDITGLKKPLFRLAALFDSEDNAKKALRRLKADKNTIYSVSLLVGSAEIPKENVGIKQFLRKYKKTATDIALFRELYHNEKGSFLRVKTIYESGECFSLEQLQIDGNDLMQLGFSGSIIGIILDNLLDRVIQGEIPNTRNKLIKTAKNEFTENLDIDIR